MKSIIKELFAESIFEAIPGKSGTLYFQNNKTYWFVIEIDNPVEVLTNQDVYFKECQQLISTSDIDKNLSLLVLMKIADNTALNFLQSKFHNIEEDPYLFKKYVLYYTESEVRDFKDNFTDGIILNLLKKKAAEQENFHNYKTSSSELVWTSLMYRLLHKLPFIQIEVESIAGTSIFETNNMNLSQKQLLDKNDLVLSKIMNLSEQELKSKSANEIFNLF